MSNHNPVTQSPQKARLSTVTLVCLGLVYVIWGSTYFATKIILEHLPPLGFQSIRFTLAGLILLVILRLRGAAWPTLSQWKNSAIVGILLLVCGTGAVATAQQEASSSVAAMMLAITPLFAMIFAYFGGESVRRREWVGIGIGLLGIVLLNIGELHATPRAAFLLILSPLSWTFGSQLSKRLDLPAGLMTSAAQMLVGGPVLLVLSFLFREPWHAPTTSSVLAIGYLVIFGSLLAFSAYLYLVEHTRSALATSYAYVNPIVAVILGIGFGGEHLNPLGWAALLVILSGVLLVMWPARTEA